MISGKIQLYLIEHEGKRIVSESCNASEFRSAIRFIKKISISRDAYIARWKRRQDRQIAEKARRGTPIKYRMPMFRCLVD